MRSFHEQLQFLVDQALKEDIGDGDHSALSCIPENARGKAVLKIKQDGILAGMEVAEFIFKFREPSIEFIAFKKDGEEIKAGEKAFEVSGKVHTLLQCERVVLNCMQRMSGIATLTRSYVNKIKGYRCKILDTRKTTPNFRLLEKEAVKIGGGENHRMGLYDMIMLKDNHIDFSGSIENAIERAYEYVRNFRPGLKIEVETRNIEEVKRVLATGKANRIMLDNFTVEDIITALKEVDGKVETEASGGINLDNITSYAATGVDYISVGALIHQAKSIDLSLKAIN